MAPPLRKADSPRRSNPDDVKPPGGDGRGNEKPEAPCGDIDAALKQFCGGQGRPAPIQYTPMELVLDAVESQRPADVPPKQAGGVGRL